MRLAGPLYPGGVLKPGGHIIIETGRRPDKRRQEQKADEIQVLTDEVHGSVWLLKLTGTI